MKKYFLILSGFLLIIIGTLGIFIPLLPTTPFLLLAAFCFLKSSDKLYQKLINNKIFGIYIKNYIEKKTIPTKLKLSSILFLFAGISLSFIFFTTDIYVRVFLVIVFIAVSIHIILLPTANKK